jgi:hypothetical protein
VRQEGVSESEGARFLLEAVVSGEFTLQKPVERSSKSIFHHIKAAQNELNAMFCLLEITGSRMIPYVPMKYLVRSPLAILLNPHISL